MSLSAEMKETIRDYAGEYVGGNAQYIDVVGYTVNWNGKRYASRDTSVLAEDLAKVMEQDKVLVATLKLVPDPHAAVHRTIRVTAKDNWVFMRLMVAAEIIEAAGMANDFYPCQGDMYIDFTTDEVAAFNALFEMITEGELSAFENCRIAWRKGE
jgi:hypothetical protein